MSMFEYLFTTLGGFTYLLIGLSVLGIVFYGPYLSVQLYLLKKKTLSKTSIDSMLVLGVVVFMSGILNQIAGMIEALETMINVTDVSPKIVMGGIIESFTVPVMCTFMLIVALLFWYLNKIKCERLNG